MSVQVSSKNIFLNTQKSGSVGSGESNASRFKMCLNNIPLQTGNNQFSRLSLVNFCMYRNFYLVNKWNNKFHLHYTFSGTEVSKVFYLTEKDYADIGDIAEEFQTQLISAFAGGSAAVNFIQKSGTTRNPPSAYYKGDTGTGILDLHLITSDGSAHGISDVSIQARQFKNDYPTDFGDSYALMGGKRITRAEDDSGNPESSFTMDWSTKSTSELTCTGFYPMQRTTTPYLYLRANESVKNLESENYKAAENLNNSTHIVSSTILGKIPVSDVLCVYDGDMSTPYYVDSDNRNIAEIQFTLTDQHNRDIPEVADDQQEAGNFSCELVLNYSVWTKSTGNPINNNIETNQVGFNVNAGAK